jgi:hypothetical protein
VYELIEALNRLTISPGNGDGPRRDELLLGGVVLTIGVPDAAAYRRRVVRVIRRHTRIRRAFVVSPPCHIVLRLLRRNRAPPVDAPAAAKPPRRRRLCSSLTAAAHCSASVTLSLPRSRWYVIVNIQQVKQ